MILYVILQASIAATLCWSFLKGRQTFLTAVGFVLALNGLSIFGVVNWTWPKLVPMLLLAELAIRGGIRRVWRVPGARPLMAAFLYAAMLAAWYGLVSEDARALIWVARGMGWGPAQSDYRHIIQLATFLGTWGTGILVAAAATGGGGAGLLKGLVWGCVASVVAGIYQTVAIPAGLPWFDGAELAEATSGNLGLRESQQLYQIAGLTLSRLYGLGGEPKHTAAFAVIALCAVLGSRVGGAPVRFPLWVIPVLIAGLALTLSTSGWVAAAVALATIGIVGRTRGRVYVLGTAGAVLALGLLIGADARHAILDERVVSRLESVETLGRFEHKDAAYVYYALDEPIRAAMGHAPGGVDFFLLDRMGATTVQARSTITPTYPPTKLLSDVGLAGVALLAATLIIWVRSAERGRPIPWLRGLLFASMFMPYVVFQAVIVGVAAMGDPAPEARNGRQQREGGTPRGPLR